LPAGRKIGERASVTVFIKLVAIGPRCSLRS
jgi:hypothetical protein